MPSTTAPLGVHLVGSICGAASASDAFQKCIRAFPQRLKRLPDGEPAHRSQFTTWQTSVFSASPSVLRQHDAAFNPLPQPLPSAEEVAAAVSALPPLRPMYDDVAIESYAEFTRLRAAGKIPASVKFMVCLPSLLSVMVFVRPGFQAAVERLYEAALLRCVRRIEDVIPAQDLAIQWDIAIEPAMLEGMAGARFERYFEGDLFDELISRAARLVGSVKQSVEVGCHVCYGDVGHKHFVEPKDMGLMVRMANAIKERGGRPVQWFHMPVPKDRDDVKYFAPLEEFQFQGTELYLGLVHAADPAGTERRLAAANAVLKGETFGVATECGMGRTPLEDFDSIAEISTVFSSPVVQNTVISSPSSEFQGRL